MRKRLCYLKSLSSGNFLVLQLHQSQIDYYSEYFTLIDGVVGGDQFSKFQIHITTQHKWRKRDFNTSSANSIHCWWTGLKKRFILIF